MLKRLALCLFLLSPLAVCVAAPALAQAPTAEIVIDDDWGGMVEQQITWLKRSEEAGVSFRFRGMCSSACLLNLHNVNKCVEPTASFGFHRFKYQLMEREGDSMLTGAYARRWLPEPLVKFIYSVDDSWPRPEYKMLFLSAKSLVEEFGVIAWCPGFEEPAGEVEPSK